MLRSLNGLIGYRLRATDGDLGRVSDFLFDDWVWTIRYAVVETRDWLTGRQVILSPASLETPATADRVVPVSLSRQQIERSPSIDADAPVSLQMEKELATYFQWPSYWTSAGFATGVGDDPTAPLVAAALATAERSGDPHLRSFREANGYRVLGRDGELGRLSDLILDDDVWAVRYAVLSNGRSSLVASEWIQKWDWSKQSASTVLSKKDVDDSPPYDPDSVLNRPYEDSLYWHFGQTPYWKAGEDGPSGTA